MGDAAVIYITDTIVDMGPCYVCGVRIGAPRELVAHRRKDGKNFHCVNGHAQCFVIGKTEEQKLREELEAQKRLTETARASVAQLRMEREAAERRVSAARGQVTKIKNRVGNGVCPCCNRTFQNLQRHMHTQHPGFANEEAAT